MLKKRLGRSKCRPDKELKIHTRKEKIPKLWRDQDEKTALEEPKIALDHSSQNLDQPFGNLCGSHHSTP
jgi:hypothetical protein